MAVFTGFQLLVLDIEQQGLQGCQGEKAISDNRKTYVQQNTHLMAGDGAGLSGKKHRSNQAENSEWIADQKQVLDWFAPHRKQQHDDNDVGDGRGTLKEAEFPALSRRNQ